MCHYDKNPSSSIEAKGNALTLDNWECARNTFFRARHRVEWPPFVPAQRYTPAVRIIHTPSTGYSRRSDVLTAIGIISC